MKYLNEVLTNLHLQELLSYGFWDLSANVVISTALAVPAFLIFWVIWKKKFRSHRIQQKRSNFMPGIRREIRNSLVSLVILTVVDILIYLAQLNGYTLLYTEVSQYGWWYLGFSAIAMIFLHDTIYYFLHRLMHHPKLYNHVHRVHHQSTDPSPFAAFSFHPLEAVVESLPYVIFAFCLPVHVIALWTWQLVQITMNIIAHLGYEIYPKGFNSHWLFKLKITSTHHNMHHEKVHGNYGFYFTWWDRLFKTEFKEYNETYNAIQEGIEKERLEKKEAEKVSSTILNDSILHNASPEAA